MNRHPVRAGPGKRLQKNFGLGTHQVDVKSHFGQRTNGGNDAGTKRNIRHKMSVHYVQVQPIPAGALHALHLGGQPGEICGQ